MSSVGEVFAMLKSRTEENPGKVTGLRARYQFDVTGAEGGVYHAVFADNSFDIGAGAIENPGCTLTITAADFQSLVAGKLNPMTAFMTGKLKVKGDMGLAMKLQSLLS